MRDVFISYSHKDASLRAAVSEMLEENGTSCWYAPRDIMPGEEWADAITRAMRECRIVILLFTEHANGSVQVLREVGLAVDFKKTIIPFRCGDAQPDGSMQYYLSTLHWLDAGNEPEKCFDQLLNLTRKSLSFGTEPAKAADIPEKPKKNSGKLIPAVIIAVLVLLAGAGYFLLSGKNAGQEKKPDSYEDYLQYMDRDLYDAFVNGTYVMGSGADFRSVDWSNVTRSVLVFGKYYYFDASLDSESADDYLCTILEDNMVRLTKYEGTGVSEIVIPEIIDGLPVSEIGENCFAGNTAIVKAEIPDTVDYINYGAFSGCKKLTEIGFPAHLANIEADAFAESGLREVRLPDSVRTIGEGAFWGCKELKLAFLPEQVDLLPAAVFQNDPALEAVTIMANKLLIDDEAFDSETAAKLIGIPGSYTETYARLKGIPFEACEAVPGQ